MLFLNSLRHVKSLAVAIWNEALPWNVEILPGVVSDDWSLTGPGNSAPLFHVLKDQVELESLIRSHCDADSVVL